MDYYKLDSDKKPVILTDQQEAAGLFDSQERIIAQHEIPLGVSDITIRLSTVFTVTDLNTERLGEPLLFETEVSALGDFLYARRYTSWQDAEKGHSLMLSYLNDKLWVKQVLYGITITSTNINQIVEQLTNALRKVHTL